MNFILSFYNLPKKIIIFIFNMKKKKKLLILFNKIYIIFVIKRKISLLNKSK